VDPIGRKRLLAALQIAFIAAALWMGGRLLLGDWSRVGAAFARVEVSWPFAIASVIPVLAAYAVLVETWRGTLRAWNAHLSRRHAATIWFVSSLGRYIPGKLWQIVAMSGMAQRCGVSPVVATASSLMLNLASIVTGFLVVLGTGAQVLTAVPGMGGPGTGLLRTLAVVIPVGLVFLSVPAILPRLVRWAARITGRSWTMPAIPSSALWGAVLGTAAAWLLYGLGFELLARAVWGETVGGPGRYVSAFAFSYLIGYLALFAPGGIVVRELALVEALRILGLATPAAGFVLALASRLWLTVLEILLGVLFIPFMLRLPTPPVIDDSPGR
jgi:hypothetical protein